MNYSIVVLIAFSLILGGCSSKKNSIPPEVIDARPVSPYYIVKKGDSVDSVAQKHQMKKDELIKINNLKSPHTLFPGQRILVNKKKTNNFIIEDEITTQDDITIKPLKEEESNSFETGGELSASSTTVIKEEPLEAETHLNKQQETLHKDQTPSLESEQKIGLEKDKAVEPKIISTPSSSTTGLVTSTQVKLPLDGEILSNFGDKLPDGSISDGIRISAPAGTKIKAAADGIVKDAGTSVPGYGNIVVIKHPDNKMTIYSHLKESLVKKGEKVSKGKVIGTVGNTGNASKPMLYFQARDKDLKPIDPTRFLN